MFSPAARSRATLKLALTGPSGSGKTKSALLLAEGLAPKGKIALIDSENDSASLYADSHKFDTAPIYPPYTVEKYIKAIRFAEQSGYDVLIIDSLSHPWSGEGGLLQQKEALDQRGGNSYTNWAKITPLYEQLISAILHSKIHIICTMRSKQDYVMVENSKGKQAPMKVGLAPVQREGLEYEFTAVLDIAMNHEAVASKDRTGLFGGGKMFKITQAQGKELRDWLSSAAAQPSNEPSTNAQTATPGKETVQKPASASPIQSASTMTSTQLDEARAKSNPIKPATQLENNAKPTGPAQQPQIGFDSDEKLELPGAKPAAEAPPAEQPKLDRKKLLALMKARRWTQEHVLAFIQAAYGARSTQQLPDEKYQEVMDTVEGMTPGEAIKLAQAMRERDVTPPA